MTTQFLLVVVFVFKQESEVTVGDEDNKSCFPLRSKPNYSFLSLPPALPSHRSGCCIQALVLLASHRNLSQIHLNTRPISTQSVVLFQIPYRAFPHFTFLKTKTKSNYYHKKYLQFTKIFFGTKQLRTAQLNYQQILTSCYSTSDRTKVLLHSENTQPSPGWLLDIF